MFCFVCGKRIHPFKPYFHSYLLRRSIHIDCKDKYKKIDKFYQDKHWEIIDKKEPICTCKCEKCSCQCHFH